ncbi:MAG: urease accessory protein UreH domain-containing protein, partial [Anaerolineae bacterium]
MSTVIGTHRYRYYVSGMHCHACELLVEKKLGQLKSVRSAKASLANGEVVIEYRARPPTVEQLNHIFTEDGYTFSEQPFRQASAQAKDILMALAVAAALIATFLALNRWGLSELVDVRSGASLVTLFALGLMAGVSTCAALVGGVVLSLSQRWAAVYPRRTGGLWQMQPPLFFNAGRLASYSLFGAALGAIGSRVHFSPALTASFAIAVSFIMLLLGLQMLGVRAIARLRLGMPRLISRYASEGSGQRQVGASHPYLPFIAGALTVLLPCGFTLTSEGLAALSGNPFQGALIMLAFALGTTPALFLIGLGGVRVWSVPSLSARFSKAAGILVLFFALFNINAQLNVLGIWSLSNLSIKASPAQAAGDDQTLVHQGLSAILPTVAATVYAQEQPITSIAAQGLAPIVDGKQVLRMDALASGYRPNRFRIRVGVPVVWEITDRGTSGCTNAIISPRLFRGQVDLTPGRTSVVEFTPTK